jgi:hypothetical protein
MRGRVHRGSARFPDGSENHEGHEEHEDHIR